MAIRTVSLALAAGLLAASAAWAEGPPADAPAPVRKAAPRPAPASIKPAPKPAAAKPALPAAPAVPVAGIVVSAPAPIEDWRPLDAENTLIIDTDKGRIVVELRPEFAPFAVARIKRLARSGVYDGLQFHRVIDGFMAETGAPNNMEGGRSLEPDLAPEFTFRLGAEIPRAQVARPQGESEGFIGAQPYAAVDEIRMATSPDRRVSAWGAFCAGVVAMAHGAGDAGNSEFFIMRSATRSLDRSYSVVGRVVAGLDAVRALTPGDPPMQASRMHRVRVMADLPESLRPQMVVLNTLSPAFRSIVDQVRAAKGADFSVCDVEAPVRITQLAPQPPPPPRAHRRPRHKPAEAEPSA